MTKGTFYLQKVSSLWESISPEVLFKSVLSTSYCSADLDLVIGEIRDYFYLLKEPHNIR